MQYAKFTAEMDVCLLELIEMHNPFTAVHGTTIQMWILVAEKLGQHMDEEKDFAWHTCRDRVDAMLRLHEQGEVDRLYKKGDDGELNQRKQELLGALSELRKLPKAERVLQRKSVQESCSSSSPPTVRIHNSSKRKRKTMSDESEMFRARVLELLETKVSSDAEFQTRELELRREELKLQEKFLSVLREST